MQVTRQDCHSIAREYLGRFWHENDPHMQRVYVNMARHWLNITKVVRKNGPLRFKDRSCA